MDCGRGNYQIRLGEGVAGLPAVLDQEPPPEHDVLCDGKDTVVESRPYRVREPIVQLGPSVSVADEFDAPKRTSARVTTLT
jgi:hypothetical protein